MSFGTMIGLLAQGLLTTCAIFFLTLLGSQPLGLLFTFGKTGRFKPVRAVVNFLISVLRGTPLMLQLMVVYYGPSLLLGLKVGQNWRFWATIVAFVINYAAYFAEIYRGGLEAIPVGQHEAAQVLGYSKKQTFVKILLPQMIRNCLPSITNETITLVKDTSLASAIGTIEMFTKAEQIAVAPNSPGMLTFVAAAVFYYVFNIIVAFVMGRIEKAMRYF